MNDKLTEEQIKDVEERRKAFTEDYLALVEKYQVDMMSYPQMAQTPRGSFDITVTTFVADRKYAPVRSPVTFDEAVKSKKK